MNVRIEGLLRDQNALDNKLNEEREKARADLAQSQAHLQAATESCNMVAKNYQTVVTALVCVCLFWNVKQAGISRGFWFSFVQVEVKGPEAVRRLLASAPAQASASSSAAPAAGTPAAGSAATAAAAAGLMNVVAAQQAHVEVLALQAEKERMAKEPASSAQPSSSVDELVGYMAQHYLTQPQSEASRTQLEKRIKSLDAKCNETIARNLKTRQNELESRCGVCKRFH